MEHHLMTQCKFLAPYIILSSCLSGTFSQPQRNWADGERHAKIPRPSQQSCSGVWQWLQRLSKECNGIWTVCTTLVNVVSEELQMEIQAELDLQGKFREFPLQSFYRHVPDHSYARKHANMHRWWCPSLEEIRSGSHLYNMHTLSVR